MTSAAVTCYIAVGSNLGDRRATIAQAIDRLRILPAVTVVRESSLLENPAVGGPAGSPAFLNGAIEISTTLSPEELLQTLLKIESALGRERRERWAARTIDLDLLLYGDHIVSLPELTIPHPRLRERRFVLLPLVEIAPDLRLPVTQERVADLLSRL